MTEGAYEPRSTEGHVLGFARVHDGARIVIVLNLASEPATVDAPAFPKSRAALLSTYLDREGEITTPLVLRPNEGVILQAT